MLRAKLVLGVIVVLAVADSVWIGRQLNDVPVPALQTMEPRATEHGRPAAKSDSSGPEAQPETDVGGRPVNVPDKAVAVEVVDHTDGDTLSVAALASSEILDRGVEVTVRLLEIDTPESVDPGSPQECYSIRASKELQTLAPLGAPAWALADRELLDPCGRTLLYLWNADGEFINLEMVRGGYARAVLFEPNDLYIGDMRRAERKARTAGIGMWGKCSYFGQPMRLVDPVPSEGRTADAPNTGRDPRFATCSAANEAGFGNYRRGIDGEYEWYVDADADGLVCEF